MTTTINELVKAAHQNAVSKGWWEEERTFGELIALILSEASEALEDYRNGQEINEVWYENKELKTRLNDPITPNCKPCGIPSELADIVIRVFDTCGRYGWGEKLEKKYSKYQENPPLFITVDKGFPFAENLTIIQGWLTDAYRSQGEKMKISYLALVIEDTYRLAEFYQIDLDKAIAEKMAYNATRPQRHGGKVI